MLRDPSETKHAKNTAILLPLVFKNTTIIDGSIDAIIEQVNAISITNAAILYPSETAQSLDNTNLTIDTLIVLDGSWKKAYKLFMSIPVLQSLPCVSFANPPATRYTIRKSKLNYSLSSFEATAHALKAIELIDVSPALTFFDRFITMQISSMPKHVQSRYFQK
ncbi:hypothetical protein PALB_30590 [Pseudoalteromonas luteoviolacea B = ATCC 29581]|nr:hypothetical protein PALB_30590 [Pseudoalteromonas luteoviolacea B = ATCC 29581]